MSIQFTENYEDLSNDTGYQFKFFCNRCGNGYMSSFKTSQTKAIGGLLRSAGSMFGGALGKVGAGEFDVERLAAGPGHDRALQAAVDEIRPLFNQCSRCGTWVCKQVCWNAEAGLCTNCAPKLEGEIAHARSDAQVWQIQNKAMNTDLASDINVKDPTVVRCPKCMAETKGGKFCPECGAPLISKKHCTECGHELDAGVKFCQECGARQADP